MNGTSTSVAWSSRSCWPNDTHKRHLEQPILAVQLSLPRLPKSSRGNRKQETQLHPPADSAGRNQPPQREGTGPMTRVRLPVNNTPAPTAISPGITQIRLVKFFPRPAPLFPSEVVCERRLGFSILGSALILKTRYALREATVTATPASSFGHLHGGMMFPRCLPCCLIFYYFIWVSASQFDVRGLFPSSASCRMIVVNMFP